MRNSAVRTEGVSNSPLSRLAEAAAGGDVVATSKLIEAVAPLVTRTVRAIVGRAHPDVDDVMQQALVALTQALPRFRGECEPQTYATGIAVRVAIAARRRARAESSREDDAVESADLPGGNELLESVQAARRKALLRELLDTLPQEQAEALALKFVLGWSLEEIASATNAPVNTVRSRMRLAKEALRRRIEANPQLAEELEVPT